jgi:hypothetical protein
MHKNGQLREWTELLAHRNLSDFIAIDKISI